MTARNILIHFRYFLIPAVLFLAQGCSFYSFSEKPVETEALKNIPPEYSMAVMPVANYTKKEGLDRDVRSAVYRSLAPLNYTDIELGDVREAVADATMALGGGIPPHRVPPSFFQDGKLADSLLYVEVEKLSKVCLLIFGQIRLDVKMKWIDSRTGEVLYTNDTSLKNRKIILPTSLTGLASIVTVLWFSVNEKEVEDTVEEFGRRIARVFPDHLPSSKAAAIDRVEARFPGKRIVKGERAVLVPGDVLEIRAIGTMGQTCTFCILGDVTGLPMEEDPPGVYVGRYTIVEGDTCEVGMARVTMKTAWGTEDTQSTLDAGYRIEAGPPRPPVPRVAEKEPPPAVEEKPAEKPEPPQPEEPVPAGPKMKTAKWFYQEAGRNAVDLDWDEMGSAIIPPMRGGDTFWFEFEAAERAWLYIFSYDTNMELYRLFPLSERDAVMQNPLPPGKKVRAPSADGFLKGRFTLAPVEGDSDLKEAILVLLSREPREDLEALYAAFKQKETTVSDKAELITELKALVDAMRAETPASASKRLLFIHQR